MINKTIRGYQILAKFQISQYRKHQIFYKNKNKKIRNYLMEIKIIKILMKILVTLIFKMI